MVQGDPLLVGLRAELRRARNSGDKERVLELEGRIRERMEGK